MISTRSVGLLIDTVVCLTLAKWETVSGRFGGYFTTIEHAVAVAWQAPCGARLVFVVRMIKNKDVTGRMPRTIISIARLVWRFRSPDILAASPKCGLLNQSHTRSISCWCPSIPKFANEAAAQ